MFKDETKICGIVDSGDGYQEFYQALQLDIGQLGIRMVI